MLFLVGVNVSCTYFSPLVGKWKDSQSQNTIEFTRDGNVILNSNGYLISGTYQLVSNDVVKLNYVGLSGGMARMFGVDTWQYSISGNNMTVEAGGSSDVFNRIDSSATTHNIQTTTTSPTIVVTYPKGDEIFRVGQAITITWRTTNLSKDALVIIEYEYPDGMGTFITGLDGVPNTGSIKWTIPSEIILNGSKTKIIIEKNNGKYMVAQGSSGFFTVTN
jgi:hypothetical protein